MMDLEQALTIVRAAGYRVSRPKAAGYRVSRPKAKAPERAPPPIWADGKPHWRDIPIAPHAKLKNVRLTPISRLFAPYERMQFR